MAGRAPSLRPVRGVELELSRIAAAWKSWEAGEYRAGTCYSALPKADKAVNREVRAAAAAPRRARGGVLDLF